MRIHESNKWKIAFRTLYSYFKYQVILFRLFNAPAIFQGYINKMPAENFDIFVIIYLGSILIYIKDLEQPHVKAIHCVFDYLRKLFFFANLKKYWFHQDKACFLGYIVLSTGINIKVKKIKVMKNWLEPKSFQDI